MSLAVERGSSTSGRGSVVLVELDPSADQEQRGVRLCIVVSDPAVNADRRFSLVAVVPVTGTRLRRALPRAVAAKERPSRRLEPLPRATFAHPTARNAISNSAPTTGRRSGISASAETGTGATSSAMNLYGAIGA